MDYNKYAENETNKGTMLVSSLTGSAMAFILKSKNYFMSQRGG